jgi:hypothetical protein
MPTSELAWGGIVVPAGGRRRPADHGSPAPTRDAAWQAAPHQASAAPGSLFAPVPRDMPGHDGYGSDTAGQDESGNDTAGPLPMPPISTPGGGPRYGTGGRPIYVWNPEAPAGGLPEVDADHGLAGPGR